MKVGQGLKAAAAAFGPLGAWKWSHFAAFDVKVLVQES